MSDLDQAMEQARVNLGLRWEQVAVEAGVSVATLRAVRRGKNHPDPLTKRGIERALRWAEGSVDAVLAGGDAAPEVSVPTPDVLDGLPHQLEQRAAALTAQIQLRSRELQVLADELARITAQ